jgi:ArsR family transcriptional regulator
MATIPGTRPIGRPSRFAPATADLELARLARALGHPVRVAILRTLLRRGECVCGTLVDQLPLAQSTVSQHLKVLREAGLVVGEVDGPRVCYCASPAALEKARRLLDALAEGRR